VTDFALELDHKFSSMPPKLTLLALTGFSRPMSNEETSAVSDLFPLDPLHLVTGRMELHVSA